MTYIILNFSSDSIFIDVFNTEKSYVKSYDAVYLCLDGISHYVKRLHILSINFVSAQRFKVHISLKNSVPIQFVNLINKTLLSKIIY